MKDHLFVASGDGNLYDTRVKGWHETTPLRRNYRYHHADIFSVADFKATLRSHDQNNQSAARGVVPGIQAGFS
jgi:hypothetical protein